MIWISILLTLFITLLVLLSIVCCIPFEYAFSGQKYETYFLEGKISWIFGGLKAGIVMKSYKKMVFSLKLLNFDMLSHYTEKKKEKVAQEKDKAIQKEKKRKNSKLNIREFLNKELLEVIFRFAAEIFNHLKPRTLLMQGSIGFDDPYYTGIFWGGLNILYPLLKDFDIQVVPIFHEEKLEGHFAIRGRIIIGVLILLAIKLLLSKPGRNVILHLMKSKKEEKAYVI